jgi:hypothetical protein
MIRGLVVPRRGDVCLVFAFEVAAVRWSHVRVRFQSTFDSRRPVMRDLSASSAPISLDSVIPRVVVALSRLA